MKKIKGGVFYTYNESSRFVHLAQDLTYKYPDDKDLHLLWRLLDQYAYAENQEGKELSKAALEDLL